VSSIVIILDGSAKNFFLFCFFVYFGKHKDAICFFIAIDVAIAMSLHPRANRKAGFFCAAEYAEHNGRAFAQHIREGDFYHDWWIRPEYDRITSHHQAPLYLRSSLQCFYNVQTCATPFELLVRNNGQYELKVIGSLLPRFCCCLNSF